MKLLIVQPYLNQRGGVDRVVLEIAKHFSAKILTLEYDKSSVFSEFRDVDVEVIGKDVPFSKSLPYRAAQGLKYGYNFYNLKLEEDYDVVNPHMSPSEWIRHKNKRVLWYCHTPVREVYDLYNVRMQNRPKREKLLYAAFAHTYKLIAGRVTKKIEAIATNSANTQDRVKKYFGRESIIINPGVDADKFKNEGDEKFFLYPARILLNKRQDYAIDAFKAFIKKREANGYKLVIAGSLSNDPEHQKYFERIKYMSKGLDIKIKLNISDKELLKLYSTCTGVLFTAINEDFGLVPLEAMASSKPVVSVNEGGPMETIVDGKTGFLVNSQQEMAQQMSYIVEHKDEAEKMGAEGRKRVENEYSWQKFFERFDPLVHQVADLK